MDPRDRDDIAETICELMASRERSYGVEGEDGSVYVSDVQMINACNHLAAGSFWHEGEEWSFLAESGDMNGFYYRELSKDAPIPKINYKPPAFQIVPIATIRNQAEAKLMLVKIKAFRDRTETKELLAAYSYDRTFQPGGLIEKHYRDRAAKIGAKIVRSETAAEFDEMLKVMATEDCTFMDDAQEAGK